MTLSTHRGPPCTAQQEISTLVTENAENMTSQASRPTMTGSESPTDPLSVRLLIHSISNILANVLQSRIASIELVECIDMTGDDVPMEGSVRTPYRFTYEVI